MVGRIRRLMSGWSRDLITLLDDATPCWVVNGRPSEVSQLVAGWHYSRLLCYVPDQLTVDWETSRVTRQVRHLYSVRMKAEMRS